MKKIFVVLFSLMLCVTVQAAKNDKELVKGFMFAVLNRVPELFEYDVTTDPKQRAVVMEKFKKIVNNCKEREMRLNTAEINSLNSMEYEGTQKRVLLVTYTYDGVEWDDIIFFLEKGKQVVFDIGYADDCFTMNLAKRGKNFANRDNLIKLFMSKPISREDVVKATKDILRLVAANKLDSFCTKLLYIGEKAPNRKPLQEACNPKMPKDKIYAKAMFESISGYFASIDDISVRWFNSKEDGVSVTILCNRSKNQKDFSYKIVNGKLLLMGVY